jgi:hypothetical protein
LIEGAVKLHVGGRFHCEKFAVISGAILIDVTEESCIVVVRNVLSVIGLEVGNSRVAYVDGVIEKLRGRKVLTEDGAEDRFADAGFTVQTDAVRFFAKDGTSAGHVGYMIKPIDGLADLMECVDRSRRAISKSEFNARGDVLAMEVENACAKGNVVSGSLFCQDGVIGRDLVNEPPKGPFLENGGAKRLDRREADEP